MAKKNSTFGKFLAFTTAIAAIGGTCYIFRDQIKESEVYKKTTDKLSSLRNKVSDKFASDEDDFFFDDEFEDDFEADIFDDNEKSTREYTSITINAKDNTIADAVSDNTDADTTTDGVSDDTDADTTTDSASDDIDDDTSADTISDIAKDVANDVANAVKEKTEAAKDEVKEIFADDSIPTISFGSNKTEQNDETVATQEVLGYENEGLSDVYEDPDVLGDQDKLDF